MALQTADPDKAFWQLTQGSPGKPPRKRSAAGNRLPIHLPFQHVPVLFAESDWTRDGEKSNASVIDVVDCICSIWLARSTGVCPGWTRKPGASLEQSPGLRKLLPYSAVLVGNHIFIQADALSCPAETAALQTWKNLARSQPDSPADFVSRLLNKDEGWVKQLADALSDVDRRSSLLRRAARLQR